MALSRRISQRLAEDNECKWLMDHFADLMESSKAIYLDVRGLESCCLLLAVVGRGSSFRFRRLHPTRNTIDHGSG